MKVRTMLVVGLFLVAGSLSIAGDYEDFEDMKGETLYLQHNLFYDDDDAEWLNYEEDDFLEVGTAVRIRDVEEDELVIRAKDGGDDITIDMDDPEPSYTGVTDLIFGSEPPSMEGLSEVDLKGIKRGRIREGMSRRAVFMAVGYPPYSYKKPFSDTEIENDDLDADILTFMQGAWDTLIVEFDDDIVVDIDD